LLLCTDVAGSATGVKTRRSLAERELAKPRTFRCHHAPRTSSINAESATDSTAEVRCFVTVRESFRDIQDSEINVSDAQAKSKRITVAGLKLHRDVFAAIVLSAANVLFFICMCWFKRRRMQRIELLMDEQRAGFYR